MDELIRFNILRETVKEYSAVTSISSGYDAYNIAVNTLHLNQYPQEHFGIFCLDAKGQVNGYSEIGVGTSTGCILEPVDVFTTALQGFAKVIVLVHNHPSGDPTPSNDDIALTKRLQAAGKLLGIPVVDHVIIGDCSFISFKAEGLMDAE